MITVRRLVWDDFNVPHIARHKVTPAEVEAVCHARPWVTQTYGGRLRVIGRTRGGRILTVILGPHGRGVFYPITARPASQKERAAYREIQKGMA